MWQRLSHVIPTVGYGVPIGMAASAFGFLPVFQRATRAAVQRVAFYSDARLVLIMPGGGYRWVVIDKEGYELGRWLAARGYTAFVLFYRLPAEGWAAGPDVALSDAQRAIRLIRHRAGHFGIDPERVAAIGFSAGGHLCADLLTRFPVRTYAPVDAADAMSARPLVAAPIYPVISMSAPDAHSGSRTKLVGDGANSALEQAHSPHRNALAISPPTFLAHAEDDDVVPCRKHSADARGAARKRCSSGNSPFHSWRSRLRVAQGDR